MSWLTTAIEAAVEQAALERLIPKAQCCFGGSSREKGIYIGASWNEAEDVIEFGHEEIMAAIFRYSDPSDVSVVDQAIEGLEYLLAEVRKARDALENQEGT
jgi:hypothetical protein